MSSIECPTLITNIRIKFVPHTQEISQNELIGLPIAITFLDKYADGEKANQDVAVIQLFLPTIIDTPVFIKPRT